MVSQEEIKTKLQVSNHGENGNLMPQEISRLVELAKRIEAKRIFEFGTFMGYTTWALARHLKGAHIWTLDLPYPRKNVKYPNQERHHLAESEIIFLCKPENERITRLFGDSTVFDFSALPPMDLVFVDGGHDPQILRVIDTLNGFKLLRRGGILVWHDYLGKRCKPLTQALDLLSYWMDLRHIKNTHLVYTQNVMLSPLSEVVV